MEEHATKRDFMSKKENDVKTVLLKRAIIPNNINEHDIYVTRKRPLIVYFKRAVKLLTTSKYHNSIYKERLGSRRNKQILSNINENQFVVIHGIGACILTAIWLTQDLKSKFGDNIDIEVTTKTIEVIDEHAVQDREWESTSVLRNISGISIKITMKVKIQ